MTARAPREQDFAPASAGLEPPAPALSQWLQLMLAEIAAKREALERARAEEALRRAELSRTAP